MIRIFQLPPQPLRLLSYLRRYWLKFWVQAVGGILYNTIIVLGPIVLGKLIDAAATIERLGPSPERLHTVGYYAVALVLITIFFQYARYIKRWWLREMSNRVANDIRAGLLGAVLTLPMEQLERENVGDLMARSVGDVNQIVGTVQYTINETWDTWLLMLSYFVVLLTYDPGLTLLCSIPIPLALYAAESARHPLYRYSLKARQASGQVHSHLQRVLNGIAILRLFGREEMENRCLEAFSREQLRWNVRVNLLQTGIMPIYASLASLGVVGVIAWGGQHVINGEWTLGRFTAYLSIFIAMSVRTRVAANVINRFHAARAAWDRIVEKLAHEPAAPNDATASQPPQAKPAAPMPVVAQNLRFAFSKARGDVLLGLDFAVPPGELVAITGPVGAGKSALAAALTGLYPYEGSIQINGRELRALGPQERTAWVAYAGQDAFIFSASIASNITLRPDPIADADDPLLARALEVSALADDLSLFPEGIATRVGERGVRVSGGQRQRIALARAIYTDAPILVLDDPFSAVDIGAEKRMIARLRRELASKTIFLFSHRLAAFTQADLILVLDRGRLVEHGAHEDLMATNGMYQRIYSAQGWLEQSQA